MALGHRRSKIDRHRHLAHNRATAGRLRFSSRIEIPISQASERLSPIFRLPGKTASSPPPPRPSTAKPSSFRPRASTRRPRSASAGIEPPRPIFSTRRDCRHRRFRPTTGKAEPASSVHLRRTSQRHGRKFDMRLHPCYRHSFYWSVSRSGSDPGQLTRSRKRNDDDTPCSSAFGGVCCDGFGLVLCYRSPGQTRPG